MYQDHPRGVQWTTLPYPTYVSIGHPLEVSNECHCMSNESKTPNSPSHGRLPEEKPPNQQRTPEKKRLLGKLLSVWYHRLRTHSS